MVFQIGNTYCIGMGHRSNWKSPYWWDNVIGNSGGGCDARKGYLILKTLENSNHIRLANGSMYVTLIYKSLAIQC